MSATLCMIGVGSVCCRTIVRCSTSSTFQVIVATVFSPGIE
ncbi:Uncharacterised protein [Mycobacteroides abscessus subsp. abscessus]|nr:Uncharacterised protein [Mycobacteroides abscessus subsp. abscessus]